MITSLFLALACDWVDDLIVSEYHCLLGRPFSFVIVISLVIDLLRMVHMF